MIPGLSERVPILQYANDTILFLRRTEQVQAKIQSCFTIFSLILGLKINLHKSVVYGVEKDIPWASTLTTDFGCKIGNFPMNYFGLLFRGGILCRSNWNYLADVFRTKLSLWKARHLSMGGRLTLIKLVLSPIPIYPLLVMILPVTIWNALHDIITDIFGEDWRIGVSFTWSIVVRSPWMLIEVVLVCLMSV